VGVITPLLYSCVHYQIARCGLFSRQSVTLTIGLTICCSHNRDNQQSEQSGKCATGQALAQDHVRHYLALPLYYPYLSSPCACMCASSI